MIRQYKPAPIEIPPLLVLAIWLILAMLGAVGFGATARADRTSKVLVVQIKGPIGVGSSLLMSEALAEADTIGAPLVILEIDTPGGLVAATRTIIKSILASRVPVAVFVSPSGARAASAGTYIAYAAHIVAMAPGTHLGAATPVQMTFPGLPQQPRPMQPAPNDVQPATPGRSAMERKALNDAIAYLRALAQLRGRSEEWADRFVKDAATLTADEAAKEGIVDVLASDVPNLLERVDGKLVKTSSGERRLSVQASEIQIMVPSWKVQFLSAITDPNIAFILLLLGVYGILFELWSPGLTGPGIIGGVSLILGLFALSALPLNYAGLALLLLGLALMVGEAVAPGFGILGIGGVVAFVLGAIFLYDPAGADIEFSIYTPLIVATAATSAILLIGVVGYFMRSHRATVVTGSEHLIGLAAEVLSWKSDRGRVRVHGEVWAARSNASLNPGDTVKVVAREGLTLVVQ
ncbi:MAG: NfeD family protein [Hyphomicrobiaceae bacterium]